MTAMQQIIKSLDLHRHPEGGYFKETYRSTIRLDGDIKQHGFAHTSDLATSIYFLLPSNDVSLFHRIKSDELWYFHLGSGLTLYVLNDNGLSTLKLGPDVANGESFQVVIPANSWFGAKVNTPDSFTLCGCVVAPGFDFVDFELAKRDELLKAYPGHRDTILLLTE